MPEYPIDEINGLKNSVSLTVSAALCRVKYKKKKKKNHNKEGKTQLRKAMRVFIIMIF